MVTQRETLIVGQIKKALSERGVWYFKTHGYGMQQSGVPDLICCVHGQFVAFEVKTPTGVESKLQELTRREIAAAGGLAFVVQSKADVINILSRLGDGR